MRSSKFGRKFLFGSLAVLMMLTACNSFSEEKDLLKKVKQADVAYNAKNFADAERGYREVWQISEQSGDKYGTGFLILDRLADSCYQQGKIEEAGRILKLKLELVEANFPADFEHRSLVEEEIGTFYVKNQDCENARIYFKSGAIAQADEDGNTYNSLLEIKNCPNIGGDDE